MVMKIAKIHYAHDIATKKIKIKERKEIQSPP